MNGWGRRARAKEVHRKIVKVSIGIARSLELASHSRFRGLARPDERLPRKTHLLQDPEGILQNAAARPFRAHFFVLGL
jgi:hypothetical protein